MHYKEFLSHLEDFEGSEEAKKERLKECKRQNRPSIQE